MNINNKLNLSNYIRKYSFFYFLAIIAIFISTILDMMAPLVVQHIVDDVLINKKIEVLKYCILGIALIGIGRCIFQYSKEFICDWCGSKIASEVRINLFQK